MKCFQDMAHHIHQKRIWRPWNQCRSFWLHLHRLLWNSPTSGASRHWDTTELPLENKVQTFIKQAIPLKNILACWCIAASKLCRTYHFHWKGQWASQIHTTWSTYLLPRETDDAGPAEFNFTLSVSCENWPTHFRDRGWTRLRYLPPR